jgi:hypothetical protein
LKDSLFFFLKNGGYLPTDILIKFGCLLFVGFKDPILLIAAASFKRVYRELITRNHEESIAHRRRHFIIVALGKDP